MKHVNVSALRGHLSQYLKAAARGEEVVILDRDRPIAKLVRVGTHEQGGSDAEHLSRLARSGVVTEPRGKLPSDFFRDMPKASHSVLQALLEEREEGR